MVVFVVQFLRKGTIRPPVTSSRSSQHPRPTVGDGASMPGPVAPEGFTSLYDNHCPFVWRTLFRLGVRRADLADCCQEVFVVVHRKWADFDGSYPRAWLAAIARRVASDYRRRDGRRLEEPPPLGAEAGAAIAGERAGAQDEELAAASVLHHLLDGLDLESRELFVLAELEGLDIGEAARALGTNVNTAYSKLRAARTKLRAQYARLVAQDKWRLR